MIQQQLVVSGPRPLHGRLRVPGCKGISHRALLFAGLAEGTSHLAGLAGGDDVHRTRLALGHLGVRSRQASPGVVNVHGRGAERLAEPATVLDCGNSGTTMRVLAGLLAGRPFHSVLAGDSSLSERPMSRVVEPLRRMGARIDGRAGGAHAPLAIRGGALAGEEHRLEVPSGQVKTALVLAGLQATGETEVHEPAPSRDHTERMLAALGAPLTRVDDRTVRVRAGTVGPFDLAVPGDPSSAAYFVVAALITPGSAVVLEDVSLNPGRVAYLDVLRAMGARIDVEERDERLGEPVGDIAVEASPLAATTVEATESIIDEIPALAVAAAFATGVTEVRNAAELRVKESDRIATLEQELGQLGVEVDVAPDGLRVHGGRPRAATLKSHGDHRIALAGAVAANAIDGETTIRGWGATAISYPEFAEHLRSLGGSAA